MSKKITVGEREFTLFPCPKIGLSAMGNNFRELGAYSEVGLEMLVLGIYYGVKRGALNDESITREFFEWNIDAINMPQLIKDFVEVNGLNAAAEAAAGEA
ncbi:MAG: hypothetical protein P4L87_25190 [Formivibrio sp.]|nr:hypothetical protein [Formivibrio sp.]